MPGILPVTNLGQIQRITSLCGAHLPNQFVERLSEKDDDTDWQFNVGVEFAVEQVRDLIDQGVPGIHFYVLNKSRATSRVLGLGRTAGTARSSRLATQATSPLARVLPGTKSEQSL